MFLSLSNISRPRRLTANEAGCCCPHLALPMSRKKSKTKKFSPGAEARRRARERAGSPPASKIIPDKRLKPTKHKKQLLEDYER